MLRSGPVPRPLAEPDSRRGIDGCPPRSADPSPPPLREGRCRYKIFTYHSTLHLQTTPLPCINGVGWGTGESTEMTKMSWSGAWLPVLHRLPDASSDREVALTIDDGPTNSTPGVLRILGRVGAKATFFLSGERMNRHPGIVRDIVEAGHAVYAHGMQHIPLEGEPAERIARDMTEAEAILAGLRPTPSPYLVRLPYAAGRRLPAVHKAIRAWSPTAQIAHWNASTDDHTIAGRCTDEADIRALSAAAVCRLASRRDLSGSILLMHDEPVGIPSPFVPAVTLTLAEMLVTTLSGRGYAFVPLRPIRRPPLLSRFILEK
ncbi:MAG: polysaccharide deacetylase family protein [Telmatospirillum sp.]|nr:polysaccharide deacetylase family protein [Telmatospirillum sp.]